MEKHECDFQSGSNSCLPTLPPRAHWFQYVKRTIRKMFIASPIHPQTKWYIRSTLELKAERNRHINSKYFYMIHPLSIFSKYWERFAILFLLSHFLNSPLLIAFHQSTDTVDEWEAISFVIDVMNSLDIFVIFFTGYIDSKTSEIVLARNKVAIHYLKTFFIFDILSSSPLQLIVERTFKHWIVDRSDKIEQYFALANIFRLCRMSRMFDNIYTIAKEYGANPFKYKLIELITVFVVLLHWSSCFLYILPQLTSYDGKYSRKSWIIQNNFHLEGMSGLNIYMVALIEAITVFCRVGTGYKSLSVPEDLLVRSIIMILGSVFYGYALSVFLNVVTTTNLLEMKYDAIKKQLERFAKSRCLPDILRRRILFYFTKHYQRKFIPDEDIFATLSDHLRQEVFLHSCLPMINSIPIFRGIPKATIGTIIGCLKLRIYLPHDIILRKNDRHPSLHFIYKGTVAIYNSFGKEVMHVEDSDFFGAYALLFGSNATPLTYVAVTMCEIYKLEKVDFERFILTDPELVHRMKKVTQMRKDLYEHMMF